jgi:hypothetical protein
LHASSRRSGKLNADREAPQRQQTRGWDIDILALYTLAVDLRSSQPIEVS